MSPGAMSAVLLAKIVIRPVVGASWPSIMAKQVLLPAPFGPMSARISPASSAKLTSRTAWKPEYDLPRFSATRMLIGFRQGGETARVRVARLQTGRQGLSGTGQRAG